MLDDLEKGKSPVFIKEKAPTFTLDLPLDIIHGNKTVSLNLNVYTRTHFRTLAKIKVGYENLVQSLLWEKRSEIRQLQEEMKAGAKAMLVYTLYPGSARELDVANPGSVIDKFACDAIVKAGVLPDDNWHYVNETRYRWGGVDKARPRCRLEIFTRAPAAP
jgi:hypothetical protein